MTRRIPSETFVDALLDAVAWVLPVDCAGCDTADRMLCKACRARVAPVAVSAVVTARSGDVPVTAGAPYSGTVQRVVLALKDGRTPLASALVPLLVAALERARAGAGIELAPVPPTRAASRRRGFDPVVLVLARAGLRWSRVLRPARAHRVQKGLGRDERHRNLLGVHRARGRLDGRSFLLVDDVVTTGATLAEAARAVREAGGEVVGAIAIAATPRRNDPLRGSHVPPRETEVTSPGARTTVGEKARRERPPDREAALRAGSGRSPWMSPSPDETLESRTGSRST